MDEFKKKILVAIDHSSQSLNAASYISRMVDPHQFTVVLFHVESDLYDIFYDYDKNLPVDLTGSAHFSDWIETQKRSIDLNLEQAKTIFLEHDFPSSHIQIVKQPRISGIARDIINESHKGYDILVTGKSGINQNSEIMTGTVASKLMARTFHIPLVIVSGTPDTAKVVLGYDGSKGADLAVASSARLIRKTVSEVLLCHVIRTFNLSDAQYSLDYASSHSTFLPDMEEMLIKLRRDKMEPLLDEACKVFVNEGFTPSIVRWGMINRSSSRSRAILDMAKDQKCGTLVLGRRGHSAVVEFLMGRVGRKAVEMAESLSVWII